MNKRSFPDGDERFLDRWSRRKREAEEEREESPAAAPDESAVREQDLPAIDELGADSDYSAFMQDGVPPDLRNRALRALWRSDPSRFAPDGLEEYGGDHTTSPLLGAAVKTVFKVARGSNATEPEEVPEGEATEGEPAAPDEPEDAPGSAET